MISNGQTADASDFINKAEANPTPANNEGKVPKLESNGKLDPSFLASKGLKSEASNATPAINTDLYDRYYLTAQAVNISSMSSGLTGSPVDGDRLKLKFTKASGSLAYVASASVGDTNATTVVPKPTGTADGDLLIINFYCWSGATVPTAPAGWNTLMTQAGTPSGKHIVYWKVASSEGASWTFTLASSNYQHAVCSAYRGGFNTANPIHTYSNTNYTNNDLVIRGGSLTTTVSGCPLLFVSQAYVTWGTAIGVPTALGGFTEDNEDQYNRDDTLEIARIASWSGIGATGNVDGSIPSLTTQSKHAVLIALNPAEIAVTWGTSFGYGFPASFGGTRIFDCVWNATTSKWDLAGTIIETTVGATHSLVTNGRQRVKVWAKGTVYTPNGYPGTTTVYLNYNAVAKDSIAPAVESASNGGKQSFSLIYTETPAEGTQNITVTAGQALYNVVNMVKKIYE